MARSLNQRAQREAYLQERIADIRARRNGAIYWADPTSPKLDAEEIITLNAERLKSAPRSGLNIDAGSTLEAYTMSPLRPDGGFFYSLEPEERMNMVLSPCSQQNRSILVDKPEKALSMGTATCYASRVNLQPRIHVRTMDELKQAEIERVKLAR